jgi:opacity protein-like surface antigen
MRLLRVAAGFGAAFLTGSALAQTAGSYVTSQSGSLAPFTLLPRESPISQMEGLGKAYGSAYGFDFGNGFKTQIEGLRFNAGSDRIGGLAASQTFTTTRLILRGLYEFSEGSWRVMPYVSAGFGATDVNGSVLGLATNDWATAYQVGGGVAVGFTQKVMGDLEYRWTDGSKASFLVKGVRTNVGPDDHSVMLGVNFKY